MKHQDYQEWLPLIGSEELRDEDRTRLEAHLRDCAECQASLIELEKLRSVLAKQKPVEIDEAFLQAARQQLRIAIRHERAREPLVEKWLQQLIRVFSIPTPRTLARGLVMITVGLLLGYFLFVPGRRTVSLENQAQSDPFSRGKSEITNIRFVDANPANGEIEFSFDNIFPMRIRGNINDDRIQKVLTQAVEKDQNPGVRLRAVNAFNLYTLKEPDAKIKTTLLKVLQTDENPGVRKEALKALQKFPFDEEIRNAFLHVLVQDKNSGLRIAAINALDAGQGMAELKADPEMVRVLQEKVQLDRNDYIRLRAKTVLEEMK